MSESLWLAILTSGDSDVADFTTTVEQLSKVGFSSRIAEVSDENLSGGFSLFTSVGAATGSSFRSVLLRSSLFDGQLSAFEIVVVESQSLLEGFGGRELDESDTLGSATWASQEVNLLDSSAGLEKFLNGFGFSAVREVSNEDFIGLFVGVRASRSLSLLVSVLHV